MKRFVLSCCILAATSTMVFAQAGKKATTSNKSTTAVKMGTSNNAGTQISPALSFTYKVNDFETGVLRGNDQMVKDRFEELKMIMTKDLQSLKPKIVNAPNEAEKTKWTNILMTKQNIYSAIINAASDMKGNGQTMIRKYREYQTTL
ncbi:MAG: hypothetical protein JSS82_09320 [Bacteroidetes bacterium]|nr:hypothetical protein [Bacteroidota bacterium]